MAGPFELYLVRHAIAEERGDAWPDDSKRPLTEEGMSRFRKSARGLRVEENARRVLDALAALRGDLDGFRTHFELVGRHLGRARDRWQDAAHRLDRFDGRLAEAAGRATDLDRRLPAPEVDGETGLTGTG